MKKRVSSLLVIILVVLGISACTSEGVEASNENSKVDHIEEYKVAFAGNWGYPSPYAIVPRGPGFVYLQLVFDSLVWRDEEGNIVSQLAKEWEFDEEKNQYIFTLHEGIKWHDYEDLNSDDVVFTIEYMKEHRLPWLDISVIKDVKALDDKTVVISLNEYYSPFMSNIAMGMPILPQHTFASIENPSLEITEKILIGSGPYKLEEYSVEDGNYSFKAFDSYYQGDVRVEKLRFISISEEMQSSAILRGEVDMIVPSSDLISFLENKGVNVKSSIGMVTKLSFNTEKAPFTSEKFRKALAYAIDTEEIINISQRGHVYKGETGLIPSSNKYYYGDLVKYDFDTVKADYLMKEQGYEKNNGYYHKSGEELSIEIIGYEGVKRDVDVIAKQLNQAGFKTKSTYLDMTTCDQRINDGNFDIAVTEDGVTGDPVYLKRMIESDVGPKFREENIELVNAINKQIYCKNESDRMSVLKNVQTMYADSLPTYVLYYGKFNAAYNDKLQVYFTDEGYGVGVSLPYNKLMYIGE
jgi:peptide/nickel transport system substrate-binding protein